VTQANETKPVLIDQFLIEESNPECSDIDDQNEANRAFKDNKGK